MLVYYNMNAELSPDCCDINILSLFLKHCNTKLVSCYWNIANVCDKSIYINMKSVLFHPKVMIYLFNANCLQLHSQSDHIHYMAERFGCFIGCKVLSCTCHTLIFIQAPMLTPPPSMPNLGTGNS